LTAGVRWGQQRCEILSRLFRDRNLFLPSSDCYYHTRTWKEYISPSCCNLNLNLIFLRKEDQIPSIQAQIKKGK